MACCPEPHHNPVHKDSAHKRHHWMERFKCAGFCMAIHIIYEVASYVFTASH